MTVVDIGANIGAHALPLARGVQPGGRVLAVEPTKLAFEKLCANAELNPALAPTLDCVHAALVAPGGVLPASCYASWKVDRRRDEAHASHGGIAHDTAGAIAITLDDLVAQRGLGMVDLMKLDVDGYECDVLAGAEATLTRAMPTIVLELCPAVHREHGHSFAELVQVLVDHDYRFFDLSRGRPLPHCVADLERRIPRGGGINVVARRLGAATDRSSIGR